MARRLLCCRRALCTGLAAEHRTDWSKTFPVIRDGYNGYNWLGEPAYNPFGLLMFFDTREIRPYWFETGSRNIVGLANAAVLHHQLASTSIPESTVKPASTH